MQVLRFLRAYCGAWMILCQFTGTSNAKLLPPPSQQNRALSKLLWQLKQEKDFRSLVIFKQYDGACGDENFDGDTTVPTILRHGNESSYLKAHFNSEMLMLVCLSYDVEQSFVQRVAAQLRYIRLTRIVFLWKQSESVLGHQLRELEKLARLCDDSDMLNVIFLFRDFDVQPRLYSFRRFPQFQLERRQLLSSTKIFSQRLHNRYSQPLSVASNWKQPRAMLYKTGNGTMVPTGYLLKFATEFAKMLNSSLSIRTHHVPALHIPELIALTRNKTIDFALSTVDIQLRGNLQELSTVFEWMAYLVMLPVESQISKNLIFFSMLRESGLSLGLIVVLVSLSFLLSINFQPNVRQQLFKFDYICNERVLRGLLAQSMPLTPRRTYKLTFTYSLVLFSGFMLSSAYWSFLNSYLVELPLEPRITSYDDLLRSKTKICIPSTEVPVIPFHKGADFWTKYESAFEALEYHEFAKRRLYLNTSYGYAVTRSMWYIIDRVQENMQRKLFRLPPVETGMHFRIPMTKAIPIQENFVHKDALNFYIMCIRESGLLQLWIDQSFDDIKKTTNFVSHIPHRETHVHTLVVNDFYWVFMFFLLGNAVAMVVFAMELCVVKWQCSKVIMQGLAEE